MSRIDRLERRFDRLEERLLPDPKDHRAEVVERADRKVANISERVRAESVELDKGTEPSDLNEEDWEKIRRILGRPV